MDIKLVNKDAMISLAPNEEARINAAVAALAVDPHAPSEITVKLLFNVYREYPKVVGGKTVNSKAEEEALKPKEVPKAAPPKIQPPHETKPIVTATEKTKK